MFKQFVDRYVKLTEHCASPNFDAGVFTLMHDEYATAYSKRLNLIESAEVTHLINEKYRET